jgi:hypothetical protein
MQDNPVDSPKDTTKLSMDWKNNLPEEVQGWQEVQQSDSPEKFFDQIANMRKRMGQSIRVPGQDAGEDQLNEFYNNLEEKVPGLMRKPNPEDESSIEAAFRAMGMPENPEEYTLQKDDVTDAELKDLQTMAKNIGMTKKQFNKFSEAMLQINRNSSKQFQENIDSERNALLNDWGAATDERMNEILNIAEATGASPAMVEAIKNKTVDAHTAKWLYQLGQQLGGEEVNAHIQQKTMAPDEASESINDIMNNSAHPYWDASHPDHDKAVQKVIKLHRLASGEKMSA